MSNQGAFRSANATVSAHGAAAVTKSDTAEMPICRSLWIGVGGDIKVTMADGQDVTFVGVPSGSVLPVQVIRVWNTGTGAGVASILALY